MNASELLNISPLLMDRVRLTIMAKLSLAGGAVDFNTLLEELDLTKGNLSSHLSKLEEADLLSSQKAFVGKKPRSTYVCTAKGITEMQNYLTTIEAFLKKSV